MRALLIAGIVSGLAMSLAQATPPAPVQDVTGVEWGDVLYIRQSATAAAPIVGAIPYNGRGIDLAGTASGGWVKVRYRDKEGFVAAKFLKPAADEGAPVPAALECHGTEPFWTIKIGPKDSTYQFQDEAKEPMALGPLTQAANRSDGWMAVGGSSKAPTAVFLSRAESCSNGMSDDVFPYSITAKVPNGGVVSGCCK